MNELKEKLEVFVASQSGNYVSAEDCIDPRLAGMRIYDAPLLGFASASDELFTAEYKKPGVVHPDYMAPTEWLPDAKTVISFFLPYSEAVRVSNRTDFDEPYAPGLTLAASPQWLHARVEGQAFLNQVTDYIGTLLREQGYAAICPTTDPRFRMLEPYVSNWSERHAAYAAGLGTFGLSKGLITEKGMAGRFGSVITNAEFPVTKRPYASPFEYCIMCGACGRRCPVDAIDAAKGCAAGKDHTVCEPHVSGSRLPPHGPKQIVRYGCGKCQTGVPCEHGIPKK